MHKLRKWTEIYTRLLEAGGEHALAPKDLETLALAAYMTGRDAESYQTLERAHLGYLNSGKTKQAARSAFWLGLMLINAGENARGSGWMARGERLLGAEQSAECSEKGLFLIPAALGALYGGNAGKALELFEQAVTIGEQFGDEDLIALGRLGQGQAMIQQGKVAEGIKLLDETMITVETGEIFPIAAGIVYCAVIETCRKVWDLRRAREWTAALTRWCNTQQDIVPFRGQCLVRRAEIIQFHGEWQKALQESSAACDILTRPPAEPAAGEAYYRKAELLRLLGNFKEAESCYREAAKWDRNPQPGLALVRLSQGQYDAAETSIRNTLQETKDIKKRAELLPAVVRIMIAVQQTAEAGEAGKELLAVAKRFNTPYLYAISSHCQGAIAHALGHIRPALEHAQKALKIWTTLHLPYESAHTRELKGLVYRKLNDKDNSEVELTAAKWVFEQLNAKPDLERVNRLLSKKRQVETHGLTLREIQVLQRIAAGKTNKHVAGELFISERTVDRHVSNIFNKLGVSSRVEASTFALKNMLLDKYIL